MVENKNYTFEVSLSKDCFRDKRISSAMIGSSRNIENRETRKEYGFSSTSGVGFEKVILTPQDLLNELLEGKVFCHLFNPQKTRKDGTFGSCEKRDENFLGSYVIGVDIDKTSYSSAKEYISTLTLPPTFYYTSYSNKKEGKGARFRLIYVFSDKIIGDPYYFRYCSKNLNDILERDSREKIEDDCNLRCSQYFNGTYKNAKGINLEYGISNKIYSLRDIGVNDEGFHDFIKHKCYYKTLTKEKKDYIKNALLIWDKYSSFNTTEEENRQQHTISIDKNRTPQKEEEYCSRKLIEEMKKMSYDDFMRKNRRNYKLVYRQEKEEWIDGIYQYTGENYFSLYWNSKKVKDGEKRRKKIFERICLRRVMNPEINADTLLFNAYEDRYRFFEIDQDLSIDCLVNNVERAMELEISEIEELYSKNIEYLKSKAPKSGIIIRKGISEDTAGRNELMKEIRWNLIGDYYDRRKSIKENLEIINENLFKVSKKTLYRYCKEKGIKTDSRKLTDEELMDILDPKLSFRKNLTLITNEGYKCDRNRILKVLKELKNNNIL